YRMASAKVDLPLPRGPIMQVSPLGRVSDRPGRNPPLISICSSDQAATIVFLGAIPSSKVSLSELNPRQQTIRDGRSVGQEPIVCQIAPHHLRDHVANQLGSLARLKEPILGWSKIPK